MFLAAFNDATGSRSFLTLAASCDGRRWQRMAVLEDDPVGSFSYPNPPRPAFPGSQQITAPSRPGALRTCKLQLCSLAVCLQPSMPTLLCIACHVSYLSLLLNSLLLLLRSRFLCWQGTKFVGYNDHQPLTAAHHLAGCCFVHLLGGITRLSTPCRGLSAYAPRRP